MNTHTHKAIGFIHCEKCGFHGHVLQEIQVNSKHKQMRDYPAHYCPQCGISFDLQEIMEAR